MSPAIRSIASRAALVAERGRDVVGDPGEPSRRSSNACTSSVLGVGELVGRVEALDSLQQALGGAAVGGDLGLEAELVGVLRRVARAGRRTRSRAGSTGSTIELEVGDVVLEAALLARVEAAPDRRAAAGSGSATPTPSAITRRTISWRWRSGARPAGARAGPAGCSSSSSRKATIVPGSLSAEQSMNPARRPERPVRTGRRARRAGERSKVVGDELVMERFRAARADRLRRDGHRLPGLRRAAPARGRGQGGRRRRPRRGSCARRRPRRASTTPAIVTLYELGERDGRAVLVSELVPGETLAALRGRRRRSATATSPRSAPTSARRSPTPTRAASSTATSSRRT